MANGVIERLFRTLKEQGIHGRVFQTIDEVRDAVRAFAARYNTEWLIEKTASAARSTRVPHGSTRVPHGSTRTSGAPHSPNLCPESRVWYTATVCDLAIFGQCYGTAATAVAGRGERPVPYCPVIRLALRLLLLLSGRPAAVTTIRFPKA
jgi:hypothetical protein